MHNEDPPPYVPARTEHRSLNSSPHYRNLRPTQCQPAFFQDRSETATDFTATKKASLDLTQRLELKLAEYNASDNAFKRWLFEILCWCVSALAMSAIIGIYVYLNNKPMAQTGALLTYTNALGKIASAALMVPTSEALGQLKWNWFSRSRTMWDFEIFDKASRGPLGAMLLLFRTRGRSLAALGALLIVLLLAIDTFFQQVVTFPNRWSLQALPGTIPRVINYKPTYTNRYKLGVEVSESNKMIASLANNFLYGNGTQAVPFGSGARPDIPITCPTGNCTWPTYETLGVCSAYTDVSELIGAKYACLNTSIDWSVASQGPLATVPYPNGTVCGHFLNATSSRPILLSGYALPFNGSMVDGEALLVRGVELTNFDEKWPYYGTGSINFTDVRLPILDVLVSSARRGLQSVYGNEMPSVHECMLAWCVKTLKSSYAQGQYDEEVIATYFEPKVAMDTWPWASWRVDSDDGDFWVDYTQNVSLRPPHPRSYDSASVILNDTYNVNNLTQAYVMFPFDDMFPSSYTVANNYSAPKLRYMNYLNGPCVRDLAFNRGNIQTT